ncbi:MAG: UbiX family flavin prenyltransferase [Bacteroidales bacterium]|nr:UbiX family flavin prenyltransferase [Bacteroidales bacterium]
MQEKQKIIVAITGASGAIYAKDLLEKLNLIKNQWKEVVTLFSDNGKSVWEHEIGEFNINNLPYTKFEVNDFYAPVASGSAKYNTMIIIPCSMGTLGRIASGTSNNLIIRAADVMLKEKRKLILVIRESPLNLIHIKNMKIVAQAGAIIMNSSPVFYSKPKNINDLISTITNRVLELAGFDVDCERWGSIV